MKNIIFLILIISNIICFISTEKNKVQKNEVYTTNNELKKSKKYSKLFFQDTKPKYAENEKSTELKRKSNGYWGLFLSLFLISLLSSGIYVYLDVITRKSNSEQIQKNSNDIDLNNLGR